MAGLASPGPIASALWTDAELEAGVCLDAIVTICDASNILHQLTEEREEGAVNEAQDQIAYADIILCNKAKLAPSSKDLQCNIAYRRMYICFVYKSCRFISVIMNLLAPDLLAACGKYIFAASEPLEHICTAGTFLL